MSLSKFNETVTNHQSLPDKPTLTAAQLKILFDKAGVDIKEYINTVLTEEIDNIIQTLQNNDYQLGSNKVSKSGDTMSGELNIQNNPLRFGNEGYILWKEDGYGDKFRIIPDFGGVGESNKLLIQSTVGESGTDPTDWKTIAYISADTGKLYILGDIDTNGHVHAGYELGVNTPSNNRHLFIGDANDFAWIDYRSNNERLNSIWFHDDRTDFDKKITAPNYEGKVNGYQFDLGTENTSDCWLPILASDKIQHRTIDNIISVYNLAKKSGDGEHRADTLTANNQITNFGTLYNDGSIRARKVYNEDVVSNMANLYIADGGWIKHGQSVSSKRYKKEIKELENEEFNPERLYELKVKQFKYKKEYQPNEKDARYDRDLVGFIAEEVAEIYPIAADYNENGEVENWNDRYIIPPMLALIQSQKKKIDELEERIKTLEENN